MYPAGPGAFGPPPPPQPPLWVRLFGPTPPPGTPLIHRNWLQRRLLSRLQPSAAGNIWFGSVFGALLAFALVLLLSTAFSLTVGPTLDQSSANAASSLSTSSGTGQSIFTTNDIHTSLYSNPLLFLITAHNSELVENVTETVGTANDPSLPQLALSGTISTTSPVTFLLLIPAIGLMIGGYCSASTDYTGRRLFSIMRGASISILYALLVLLISLFASGSLTLKSSVEDVTVSANAAITPDVFSAFLHGLLWGVVFGALGGFLRARAIAPVNPSRLYARIRGAILGSGAALGVSFVICLLLLIILYAAGQLFGPALLSASTSTPAPATGMCSALAQAASSTTQPTAGADFPTYLSFIVISSPSLALWLMALSMGTPIQISGAANLSIGLFGSNCQLGSANALLYLLLLIPAIALFIGGWVAARAVHPRTPQEAAGSGLFLAAALAIFMLILTLFASTTISESLALSISGSSIPAASASVNEGPSYGYVILASLLFGGIFGMLGSLAGRPRHLPPLQPAFAPGWPTASGAWQRTAPPPAQPMIASAVASVHPAPLAPLPGSPDDQLSDGPASSAPPDTTLPSEEPPQPA